MSDWVKSHVDLADHPKTHVLCSLLNVRVPYVIGTLHLLWHFAMRFAWRDGDLSRFGSVAIARACHADEDHELFVSRLQEAGFLDDLKIHDWHEFAGRLVRDRLRYQRSKKIRPQSVRKQSVKRPDSWGRGEESSVEKSRVEKKRDIAPADSASLKVKRLDYVYLTSDELKKLEEKLKNHTTTYLARLNGYIGQIGEKKAAAKYRSHYHTILNWYSKDIEEGKTKLPPAQIPARVPEKELSDEERAEGARVMAEAMAKLKKNSVPR